MIRPLVVIDPHDREQVERLRDLMDAAWHAQNSTRGFLPLELAGSKGQRGNAMQAALREFANPTPPKPEEPTGLGAVVEDEHGIWWVMFTAKSGQWWRNHEGVNRRWSHVNAVKVLSEGVTS